MGAQAACSESVQFVLPHGVAGASRPGRSAVSEAADDASQGRGATSRVRRRRWQKEVMVRICQTESLAFGLAALEDEAAELVGARKRLVLSRQIMSWGSRQGLGGACLPRRDEVRTSSTERTTGRV